VRPRPFRGHEDITAIQAVARQGWPAGWHPGGLAWALARDSLADEVVVLEAGGEVVGWAGRAGHEPGELLAQAVPSRPEVAATLVEWLVASADEVELFIDVHDGDDALADALRGAGFAPRAASRGAGMFRSTNDAAVATPAGYSIRSVGADETEARVAVHRAAWRPASLPWEDGRAVDPEATSSFTVAAYDAVRRCSLYDPELDLVAVAPDGALAGCCIVWLDEVIGVAEIEPLGVVPDHRRSGLAVAMCLEAANRVRAAGGDELFINTGPRPTYSAPGRAYAKAGFEVVERSTMYVRPPRSTR
jgi:ribosomal protein S18 acetylase RimI-like enzyme